MSQQNIHVPIDSGVSMRTPAAGGEWWWSMGGVGRGGRRGSAHLNPRDVAETKAPFYRETRRL